MTENDASEQGDLYDLVPPRADVLMESLRATGYSLPDAIADLIDNSLSAKARNVWLDFHWAGPSSSISLLDDGVGMECSTLIDAMRMGSQSPLEVRNGADLGRYGLGMKTASISQAKSLTVASRVSSSTEICVRRWDLDHITSVKDWHLLRSATEAGKNRLSVLENMKHGTFVLLENLDRLVGESPASNTLARSRFLKAAKEVEDHVAMVFHRYMRGTGAVTLWINDQRVDPWDPFLTDDASTQRLPIESLELAGGIITIEPYVLPHHSRLTQEKHEIAGGPAGWNAQQGFYIYRNRRLLLPGDWLGLGYRKEEHYKLARILVDIPNTMDHEWEIDVRKSRARPPATLRNDLKRIAKITRERAVTVYRHRGKSVSRSAQSNPVFVWQQRIRGKRISYVINREHPLVKDALQSETISPSTLNRLLRLIEEYIPIQQIWVDAAGGSETQAQPFESSPSEELQIMIQILYKAYILQGLSHVEALERLHSTEAFGDHFELIKSAVAGMPRGK